MSYTVDPGLYALGNPDHESSVLVTANYKLSFDSLRAALPGRAAWLLVLDTNGINVWCAAGKGTFGTAELVERIQSSGLAKVVSHRRLLVPQLGAPGVAGHEVARLSGFKVKYGPIRAKDLPRFIDAGFQATPEMRRTTFSLWERIVLIPVELVSALKVAAIVVPIVFFLAGLGGSGGYWANAVNFGFFAALALLTGVVGGAALTPALLPWLPGRAFSLKGLAVGLGLAILLIAVRNPDLTQWPARMEMLSLFLFVPAVTAFLAMNFTGASTYTSLSGVIKEMRWAVPLQILAAGVGAGFWIGSRFIA
jgi:hypothetical protein